MEKDHNKTALKAKLFAELKLSWFPVTIKYNYHSWEFNNIIKL